MLLSCKEIRLITKEAGERFEEGTGPTCTKMPATASIAQRACTRSDSANHDSLSGSDPRPNGSNLQIHRPSGSCVIDYFCVPFCSHCLLLHRWVHINLCSRLVRVHVRFRKNKHPAELTQSHQEGNRPDVLGHHRLHHKENGYETEWPADCHISICIRLNMPVATQGSKRVEKLVRHKGLATIPGSHMARSARTTIWRTGLDLDTCNTCQNSQCTFQACLRCGSRHSGTGLSTAADSFASSS